MVSLNQSIKVLGQRFDYFQTRIEDKVTKLENNHVLMQSRLDFIEKNTVNSNLQVAGFDELSKYID